MQPQHVDIVFDPHVALALLLVFVALAIVFIVAVTPIEDDPARRQQNRKD